MVDLLLNTRQYAEKEIKVFGYLDRSAVLFLTRDHADGFDYTSAISLGDQDGSIHASPYLGSYVHVSARVEEHEQERGAWALVDVSKIYQSTRGSNC